MIYYLHGKIQTIFSDSIVIDVNGVGYFLLMSHPDKYHEGDEVTIYTYQVIREDEQYLVGFISEQEKAVFTSLIRVKGLGPKSAINALSATTPEQVIAAITSLI